MSETKETEQGSPAEGLDAAKTEPSESEATGAAEPNESEGAAAEPSESATVDASGEGSAPPKKKKKKARDAAEPEAIKDRNARVRAEAAEKRRARREREEGTAPRRNLDASEVMDDALARSTHAAAGFLRKHFTKVQWVIMAGLVGWIGWEVYSWRSARAAEKSSDALFKALSAETAKVGSEPAVPDERTGLLDDRRSFPTEEERLKAAKSEYQLASGSVAASTSVLVDLGAAGVAYDLGQYKEAAAAYEKVKLSAAYPRDNDIKGRTLEGLGMALEAQKDDEGALRAFKELSNMDNASFAALGLYHQARILKAQGKQEDAIKLLDRAGEKLVTLKDNQGAIRYLRVSLLELLETLDAAKARALGDKLTPADFVQVGPSGAQQTLSAEKLKELIEEMQKRQAAEGNGEAPAAPPAEPVGEAPAAPAEPAPAPSEAP